RSAGTINILLGNGAGTFRPPRGFAAGSSPQSVALADFNDDGHQDLVVANNDAGTVSILLGKGDGTFSAVAAYAAGRQPDSVAVADFNGDSFPDLAVTNF